MQAYADGKTIQFLNGDKWVDVYETDFNESAYKYRIKPEPKYRPFKTQGECLHEMQKHLPFGCLKSKKDGSYRYICEVYWSEVFLRVEIIFSISESISHSSDFVYEEYTFSDGTPFGIKEE